MNDMQSQTGYSKHAAYRTVARAIKILKLIVGISCTRNKIVMVVCYGERLVQLPVELLQKTLSVYIHQSYTCVGLSAGYFPVIVLSHQLFLLVLYSMSVSLLMLAITRFVKSTYEILYCTCK